MPPRKRDEDLEYVGYSPAMLKELQAEGFRIRDNPMSMIPTTNNDVAISALSGLRQSLADSQRAAAQFGDPVVASLNAIAGAVAQPGPQAIAMQRQEMMRQQQMAQFEAMPVDELAPGLVEAHPEFKGLPLSVVHKLAPFIQRNQALEQQLALFNAAEKGRNARAEVSAEAKTEKQSLKDQELQIPGYTLTGEVRPTTTEAKDLRKGVAALKDFNGGIDRMIELVKKHGSSNFVGEASGEMETLAANLKLTLKEVQKLGVLSASDTAFLDAQVFDPTSKKSILTRTPTALRQLETVKGRAESMLSTALQAAGYTPGASGAVKPTTAAATVSLAGNATAAAIKKLYRDGLLTREEAAAKLSQLK